MGFGNPRPASSAGVPLKILIVEDDPTSTLILERSLRKAGYETVSAPDGQVALERLRETEWDAVVSDWMMPRMDGIELVRQIRKEVDPAPAILMVTALSSEDARSHALAAGADEYLAKPYSIPEVLERLGNCLARRQQPAPAIPDPPTEEQPAPAQLPCRVVALVASTGGPEAVRKVLAGLGEPSQAAILVVQHGPSWMLETLCGRLRSDTPLHVHLAEDGMPLRAGHLYMAPGEWHMVLGEDQRLHLNKEPPENYMRPAADPLLRSLARHAGSQAVAAILTGLGRDGTLGAAELASSGGHILVQDPSTAQATTMPCTAIDAGIPCRIEPLDTIARAIREILA